MVTIELDCGSFEPKYPVHIGSGALEKAGEFIDELSPSRVFVLSNRRVMSLHGEALLSSLGRAGISPHVLLMGDGEEFKRPDEYLRICGELIGAGLDRNSLLVLFGGGVTGDLGGFAAATVMRGIPYVHIPTTLVAQVDSSIGGKVGVNLPRGKNLLGAFYQPKMVITDPSLLFTLDRRDFSNGMAEVIKSALISSPELLSLLEECPGELSHISGENLEEIVGRTAKIKMEIVSRDVNEKGERMKLNLGHTLGHGIEAATGYSLYTHGEAVALGTLGAFNLARKMERLEEDGLNERVISLFLKFGLPIRTASLKQQDVIEAVMGDKKKDRGVIRFILPIRAGKVEVIPLEVDRMLTEALGEIEDEEE